MGDKTHHRAFCTWQELVQRGQRYTAACPHCQAKMEDKQHIIWCPAASTREQWKLSIQKLNRWMKDQGMASEVQTEILTQLARWVQRQNTTRAHGGTICRGTTVNRVGQNDRCMALAKMVRLPGQNLETHKNEEIQFSMDCSTHPKTTGCVLGHVGTL